jgi:hypothetical protein
MAEKWVVNKAFTTNTEGHLILPDWPHNTKFCGHCGKKTPAKTDKIKKHFRGQHGSTDFYFLQMGQRPVDSMYENFDDFLADINTPL